MTSKTKKLKISNLISISDEINRDGDDYPFFGVNINKEFMPTVASTSGLDKTKYKIIRKNRFVFSGMQTGRDKCIRIALYEDDNPVLVSPAYTTFEITSAEVLPVYFFMLFKSKEMDRYGAFLSDSSVRANLDWNRFCDIELDIPSVEIQKKYVAIYESLQSNLKSYENGLKDLKTVYEGYFDVLKKQKEKAILGNFITEISVKNESCAVKRVLGVNSTGEFGPTKANMFGIDTSKYKVVKKGQFAYNPSRINLGSIAMLDDNECIISPMYIVFEVNEKGALNPIYLNIWLQRKEFLRSTLFYSIGSVRDTFDFDLMKKVEIPLPSIEIQNSIANIFLAIKSRKIIIGKLKNIINNICPILIKGATNEAKGGDSNAN